MFRTGSVVCMMALCAACRLPVVYLQAPVNIKADQMSFVANMLQRKPVQEKLILEPEHIPALIQTLKAIDIRMALHHRNLSHAETCGYRSLRFTKGGAEKLHAETIEVDLQLANLRATGTGLDLAIDGEIGFFKFLRKDGRPVYSRCGDLKIDANRRLVNSKGYLLQPTIALPGGAIHNTLRFSEHGAVTIKIKEAPRALKIGNLNLFTFPNQSALTSVGPTEFQPNEKTGLEITTTPGKQGAGGLLQSFLESSNVVPGREQAALQSLSQLRNTIAGAIMVLEPRYKIPELPEP